MLAIASTLVCAHVAVAATAPATFYVNSNADLLDVPNECAHVQSTDYVPSGPDDTCTFRDAIHAFATADQTNPGAHTIDFITCGPFTVSTPLPDIPGDTKLDGTQVANADCTDAGALSPNYGYANLEGSGTGPGGAAKFPGLILDGSGSNIVGMVIGGFTDGVEMAGTGGHALHDSAVGANPFEQGGLAPENTDNGIEVESGSADDVIGYAPSDGDNDIQDDIYGNGGWGVMLDSGSGPTTVGHNFIGTDTAGHQYGPGSEGYGAGPGNGPPDGNGAGGIYVGDSSGDQIGGGVICENVGASAPRT